MAVYDAIVVAAQLAARQQCLPIGGRWAIPTPNSRQCAEQWMASHDPATRAELSLVLNAAARDLGGYDCRDEAANPMPSRPSIAARS
jgi:hypothetical protein